MPVIITFAWLATFATIVAQPPKTPSLDELNKTNDAAINVVKQCEVLVLDSQRKLHAATEAVKKAEPIYTTAAREAKAFAQAAIDNPNEGSKARAEATKKKADAALATLTAAKAAETAAKSEYAEAEELLSAAKIEAKKTADALEKAEAANPQPKAKKEEVKKNEPKKKDAEKTESPESTSSGNPPKPVDATAAVAGTALFGLSTGLFIFLCVCVWLITGGLPILVAMSRHHPNTVAIALVTLFVPCGLGWAIGLIWACTAIDVNKEYR